MKIKVNKSERLDKFLVDKFPEFSRSRLQKLIKDGEVFVNSQKVKPNFKLSEGDEVYLKDLSQEQIDFVAEELDLEILYEDDACLVINKPADMVVHPGNDGKHNSGTIANAVFNKVDKGAGAPGRPGIVHRLDKDTSGILLIAKTKAAYEELSAQFKDRRVLKSYLALVANPLKHDSGKIDAPIGRDKFERKKMAILPEGKKAVSKYKLLEKFDLSDGRVVNLVQVQILTGRTHQIRVHMSAIGNPVLGDDLYGNKSFNNSFKKNFGLKRQFLHAEALTFVSPQSGKEIKIKSPLAGDLDSVLDQL